MTISFRVLMQMELLCDAASAEKNSSTLVSSLADAETSEPSDESSTEPPPKRKQRSEFWKEDEHQRFLEGLKMYPFGPWKLIAQCVGTKTARQTMSHAQKYRQKLVRKQRRERLFQERMQSSVPPTSGHAGAAWIGHAEGSHGRDHRHHNHRHSLAPPQDPQYIHLPSGPLGHGNSGPLSSFSSVHRSTSNVRSLSEDPTTPTHPTHLDERLMDHGMDSQWRPLEDWDDEEVERVLDTIDPNSIPFVC